MAGIAIKHHFGSFINGSWHHDGSSFESTNPAQPEEVVGTVHETTTDELTEMVKQAQIAQKTWAKLAAPSRGNLLYKAADVLDARATEIAKTMTREMGKTLAEAKGETARGAAILRYYAGEGMREVGDVIPSTDSEALMFTTRTPLGVVGVITPWNFPVAIPIWKMAPALAYGNAVVLKPAQESAVTAAKVIECFEEAGFPNGVVSFAPGTGADIGKALTEQEGIDAVTFTGSNAVGKKVGQTLLARGAKYQLEMGGKNPVIVSKDADIDLAVAATISGALKSTGQKCTATSRVIVEEAVYEHFKEKLLNEIATLTVGDGLEAGTWMGPLANEEQLYKVLDAIEKGISEGADLLIGGKRVAGSDGYFVEPTVFEAVEREMSLAREEIFGPVLALIKAPSFDEALELANDSEYGLSASVFTTNIERMMTFINEMEAGLVRVNAESAGVELQAPFGGMKNSSSHSREQGRAAIEFFTSIKTVFVKGGRR